jgi:hypothetical protein
MKKQTLPKWFLEDSDAEVYDEGGLIYSRCRSETLELNNIELSLYDTINGSDVMIKMGLSRIGFTPEQEADVHNRMKLGLEWFKENNHDAYLFISKYLDASE